MNVFLKNHLNLSRLSFILFLLIYGEVFSKEKHAEKADVQFVKPTSFLKNNEAFFIEKPHLTIIAISAFNKKFLLILFPLDHVIPVTTLSRDSVVNSFHKFYSGRVEFYPESKAYGYLHNGVFIGIFTIFDTTYHVEPFGLKKKKKVTVYKSSNYKFDPARLRNFTRLENFERPKLNQRNEDEEVYKDKVCELEIKVDHTFARAFNYDSNKITGEVWMMVLFANDILISHDFDEDGVNDNVGIRIKNITIYSDQYDPNYLLKDERYVPLELLSLVAKNVMDDSCLEVWLTNRDIRSGTVVTSGLAFKGNPRYNRGICAVLRKNKEGETVKHNKCIVNLSDVKTHYLVKVMTFLHEVGHAFGAIHPKDEKCIKNERGSYYLMQKELHSYQFQSFTFSKCNIRLIKRMLQVKACCFKTTPGPWCGDGVVSGREQCDCGPEKYCDIVDPCCYHSESLARCEKKENCVPHEFCNIKMKALGVEKMLSPFCKKDYEKQVNLSSTTTMV